MSFTFRGSKSWSQVVVRHSKERYRDVLSSSWVLICTFFLFVIVFSTRIVVHLVLRSFEKGAYLVPSVNIITRPAAMILVLLLSGRSQRQAEEGMIEDAYLGV